MEELSENYQKAISDVVLYMNVTTRSESSLGNSQTH